MLIGDFGGSSINPYANHNPFQGTHLAGIFNHPTTPIGYGIYGASNPSYGQQQQQPSYPSYQDPNDWVNNILGPLRTEMQAEQAQDARAARAAVQRALIAGGFNFDLKQVWKDTGMMTPLFDIKHQDKVNHLIDLANQGHLTQSSRINTANEDAKRAITNNLAARGIISSGATGYQLGRQNIAYQQAEYGARQHVLDTIAGIYNNFMQAQRQRDLMLAQQGISAQGGAA